CRPHVGESATAFGQTQSSGHAPSRPPGSPGRSSACQEERACLCERALARVAAFRGSLQRNEVMKDSTHSVKAKVGQKFASPITIKRTEKPRFRGFSSSGGRI